MNPQVRIKTNFGAITAELFADRAPQTTANFLEYAAAGFYDNTLFHRVVPNYLIQGGGFERGMYLKAARAPIENEADNGLANRKWTLAIARTPEPHSATSQFFINLADNSALDHADKTDDGWGYCVFGEIRDGADVAATIGNLTTEERMGCPDVPENDVVIETIELIEAANDSNSADASAENDSADAA